MCVGDRGAMSRIAIASVRRILVTWYDVHPHESDRQIGDVPFCIACEQNRFLGVQAFIAIATAKAFNDTPSGGSDHRSSSARTLVCGHGGDQLHGQLAMQGGVGVHHIGDAPTIEMNEGEWHSGCR